MRTFRFRAWDKREKRMLYKNFFDRNWYATPDNDVEGSHCVRALMPEDGNRVELMQFTGLKDRKGVEIYEGDILQLEKTHVAQFRRVVAFHMGCFRYKDLTGQWQHIDGKKWEVIGHIHAVVEKGE